MHVTVNIYVHGYIKLYTSIDKYTDQAVEVYLRNKTQLAKKKI